MMRVAAPKWVQAILGIGLLFALAACAGLEPSAELSSENSLVYVPAGPFYMGSDMDADPLARPDEFPLHLVRLDGFHIYSDEVTNEMYAQCVAAGPCSVPSEVDEDGPSHHYGEEAYKNNPVVGINWDQAVAFCGWADGRLPTEAEWEKAARGVFAELYPWGNDDPSCDLSNMESCLPEPNTDQIGQYPDGESPYHANDMAGNVWEMTSDWYNPDFYSGSPNANPLGPEEGQLKVVRGGAFDNGLVDLRSAARMGLDPDQAYNDVGFRCVPIGLQSEASAPFCKSTYIPFCNDPNNPPDQNCDPQAGQDGPPNTPAGEPDFLGFTCPQGGYISFTMDGNGHSAGEFAVTINGNEYDCIDTAGHILCTGTALSQNTIATIQVCPAPNVQNGGAQLVALDPTPAAQQPQAKLVSFTPAQQPHLLAYQPPSTGNGQGLQGAQYQTPQLHSFQAATNDNCPTGMLYNPDTQQCETDPNGACEDGWTYNPNTYLCEPGDSGCPEGTTYNADQQGCTPDNGNECPPPYIYDTATETCQPPSNDDGGGACPQGFFFDQNILCCSPIKGDNDICGPNSYFSVAAAACAPLDQNGCGEGMTYNPYEQGCVPDTGGTDGNEGDECQDGYAMGEQGVCMPATGPTDGNGCGPNSYYDYASEQCIGLDENGCGLGAYFNEQTDQCTPTTGPGSPCAQGYAYNEQTNCCAPTPGNDGSTCPGDPQGSDNELVTFPTNYDYGQGYCDPGDDGECPAGYYFNSDTQTCELVPSSPTEPNSDNQCPEGYVYDPATDTCMGTLLDSPVVQCNEGQYFDYNLGYCVATTCGCALGYHYDNEMQTCVPDGNGPTGEQGCITFTESVPVCEYQPEATPVCDKGTTYVPSTGQCERDPQATQVSCSDYSSMSSCGAAGCKWVYTGFGRYGGSECQP